MLKAERKKQILQYLGHVPYVTIEQLVTQLNSSESTVRRDLDELADDGKLHRVHGGAEAINPLQIELSLNEKRQHHIDEKLSIAKKALTLIEEGDTVFIDAGSTTAVLVEMLDLKSITVVTNSIIHAKLLIEKSIETHILGGKIKLTTQAIIGPKAIDQMNQLSFDKSFIGINGIDPEGIYTPDIEEGALKRIAIDHARQAYVLADSSKFGQKSFMRFKPLEKFILITNRSKHDNELCIEERIGVIKV